MQGLLVDTRDFRGSLVQLKLVRSLIAEHRANNVHYSHEDIDHLFFTCPFVVQCWTSINFSWDVSLPLAERLMRANEVHALDFFVEASLIAAWEL